MFTPAGGSVTVCAKTTNDGLVVEVRDTGIGMHAEDIPLALEPFRQVGDDTRRKQQGTGLGLPLAKAFIELHGGSFAIASRYREGTTVRIAFPAERIVAPRVALPA
jgi:signal transduction histidine kinase